MERCIGSVGVSVPSCEPNCIYTQIIHGEFCFRLIPFSIFETFFDKYYQINLDTEHVVASQIMGVSAFEVMISAVFLIISLINGYLMSVFWWVVTLLTDIPQNYTSFKLLQS